MALCETDKLYVAVLYDQWVFRARKIFYYRERIMKIPGGFPETLAAKYENDANELLARAWELGVHCGILTDELRFWKAWTEEEARLECEHMEDEYGEEDDSSEEVPEDLAEHMDSRASELHDAHERLQKVHRERGSR